MQNNQNINMNSRDNTTTDTNDKGIFSKINYIDSVVLSSTLSYAVAEEINNEDLDFLIVFLGQIQAELAFIRVQRGYTQQNATKTEIDELEGPEIAEEAIITTKASRSIENKKVIKKKKIKKVRRRI